MKMKSLGSSIAVFLMSVTLISSAWAGESPGVTPEKIREVVTKAMQENHIPGISIAVSTPDGKVIEESFGLANVEHNLPVKKDSVFEIGSISKTFTAIGILILQEEGKLSVDDKITKYFPQYQAWSDITLKQLLQHSSGVRDVTEVEPFKSTQGKDWTPQEVVAAIAREPLDFEPGQKARYSNTGCIILGLVIEKVTGISFADFLIDRIVKPLGMTHTTLGTNSVIVPGRVSGYAYAGKLTNAEYASLALPYASGGILSTPSDLIRLARVFRGEALISKKSVQEMFEAVVLNNGTMYQSPEPGLRLTFGYSLDSVVLNGKIIPAKTGGIAGFNSFFAYYPESRTMVALTSNLNNSLRELVLIVDALFGLIQK
ncbi:MAG: serine hydrolase domain-containing protein [Syntrophobacteraceae bacterium]